LTELKKENSAPLAQVCDLCLALKKQKIICPAGGYNSINIKNGYKQLEIRSPREFEKYEDD